MNDPQCSSRTGVALRGAAPFLFCKLRPPNRHRLPRRPRIRLRFRAFQILSHNPAALSSEPISRPPDPGYFPALSYSSRPLTDNRRTYGKAFGHTGRSARSLPRQSGF